LLPLLAGEFDGVGESEFSGCLEIGNVILRQKSISIPYAVTDLEHSPFSFSGEKHFASSFSLLHNKINRK
jgi:hypothetical protein